MQRFGWIMVAAMLTACGSGSSGGSTQATLDGVPLLAGFTPGAAPAAGKGFQIVMPIVGDIPAGSSIEYCTWSDITLTQDVWVTSTTGYQTETGHHVVMFYQTDPQKPGTRVCNNEDMAEFKFGLPASAGSGVESTVLPGNLAVKLPAGSQIVINHHYLNATGKDVAQAQSALNIYFAEPGEKTVPAGSVVVTNSSMVVPVGASTFDVDCTFNTAYSAFQLVPHMHAWGTHINIDHTTSTGTQRIVSDDWNPDYAFDLPVIAKNFPLSAPYQFAVGDKIHIECDYMNTTNAPLDFGQEMCVLFTMTVNSPDMLCDTGVWGAY
jgi:hypothetical protein